MADQDTMQLTALVYTFESGESAQKWLKHAHDERFRITEGIVVTKDEGGKVHQHLAKLPGVAAGTGVGAVLGGVLGLMFPPAAIAEALALAIAGAAVGGGAVAIKDEVMDRRSFRDVGDDLQPGQSALVVVLPGYVASEFDAEVTGYLTRSVQELAQA